MQPRDPCLPWTHPSLRCQAPRLLPPRRPPDTHCHQHTITCSVCLRPCVLVSRLLVPSALGSQRGRHPWLTAPPPLQKRYRAVYDYSAADEDEVSFQDGDTIVNVQQIDDGWMYGTVERTGDTGMLPANYVEAI